MRFTWLIFLLFKCLISELEASENSWNIQIPSKEIEKLRDLIKPCPEVAQMYDIQAEDGTSITPKGNNLTVVVLGINKERHVFGTPEIRVVGGLHGNEFIGLEVVKATVQFFCLAFVKYLRKTEPLDEFDRDMIFFLNTTRIHLLPIANPDGMQNFVEAYQRNETEKYKTWIYGRNNALDFDLNRNFDTNVEKMAKEQEVLETDIREPNNTNPLQPETKMLMSWMRSEPFVTSLNYHGGEFLVSYPFDAARADGKPGISHTVDFQLVQELAHRYMDSYLSLLKRGQCRLKEKTDRGIINGAKWYAYDGSMMDYSYLDTQCIELIVEGSCEKFPTVYDRFHQNSLRHLITLLKYFKIVHWGIKGRITFTSDEAKGAIIRILHLDADKPFLNRRITKTGPDGEFYRLLLRGRYAVLVTSPGFSMKVICTTILNDFIYSAKVINVKLVDGLNWNREYIGCSSIEEAAINYVLLTYLL